MQMTKVIILNGPPRSGKDTIGTFAADDWGFATLAFKEPMYRIAADTVGMSYEDFMFNYETDGWKDTKVKGWGGKSVRDLMIAISETYIKPFFGEDYFGRKVAEKMEKMSPYVAHYIMTDGGFFAEVDALVKAGIDVYVVHMFRDGCTFEGDSRDYIDHPEVTTLMLENNGTIEEALEELTRMLSAYGLPTCPGDDNPVL